MPPLQNSSQIGNARHWRSTTTKSSRTRLRSSRRTVVGFSLSWIAVEGKSSDVLLNQLGLSETGQQGFMLEFPLAGLMLPSGWYLIVAKGCDHRMLSDQVLG